MSRFVRFVFVCMCVPCLSIESFEALSAYMNSTCTHTHIFQLFSINLFLRLNERKKLILIRKKIPRAPSGIMLMVMATSTAMVVVAVAVA